MGEFFTDILDEAKSKLLKAGERLRSKVQEIQQTRPQPPAAPSFAEAVRGAEPFTVPRQRVGVQEFLPGETQGRAPERLSWYLQQNPQEARTIEPLTTRGRATVIPKGLAPQGITRPGFGETAVIPRPTEQRQREQAEVIKSLVSPKPPEAGDLLGTALTVPFMAPTGLGNVARGGIQALRYPVKTAVERGVTAGTDKAFKVALNTGLDKWIATQGRLHPESRSMLAEMVVKDREKLVEAATKNLTRRLAEKRGEQVAIRRAVDDTIREVRLPAFTPGGTAIPGQTRPLREVMVGAEAVLGKGEGEALRKLPPDVQSILNKYKAGQPLSFEEIQTVSKKDKGIGRFLWSEYPYTGTAEQQKLPFAQLLRDIGNLTIDETNWVKRGEDVLGLNPQVKTKVLQRLVDAFDSKIISANELSELLSDAGIETPRNLKYIENFADYYKGRLKPSAIKPLEAEQPVTEQDIEGLLNSIAKKVEVPKADAKLVQALTPEVPAVAKAPVPAIKARLPVPETLTAWEKEFREVAGKTLATAGKREAEMGGITTEDLALWNKDWRAFSRKMGYSEEEIANYQRRLDLIRQGRKDFGLSQDYIYGIEAELQGTLPMAEAAETPPVPPLAKAAHIETGAPDGSRVPLPPEALVKPPEGLPPSRFGTMVSGTPPTSPGRPAKMPLALPEPSIRLPEPPRNIPGYMGFARTEMSRSFRGKKGVLDTVEQAHQAVLKARDLGENTVPYVSSYIHKAGDIKTAFGLTPEGLVTTVGNPEGRSLAINDVMSNYSHYIMSAQQRELAKRSGSVYREALRLARSYGVNISELGSTDEFWQYIARRVKGKLNPMTGQYEVPPSGIGAFKMGSKISAQKERIFDQMLEGVDLGYLYENPDQTMAYHIRGIYRLIGNKQAENLVMPLTREATKLAPATFGERVVAEPALQGRVAAKEIANAIDKIFTPEQAWSPLKRLSDISGAMVGQVASLDISAPFIQGLPLLGNDIKNALRLKPTANWAKAYGEMWKTLADPANNINTFRMANPDLYKRAIEAGVMTGQSEFVTGLPLAERAIGKIPKVGKTIREAYRQSWGRAGQAYSDNLEIGRIMAFKSLEKQWLKEGGSIYDLGVFVNRMLGGASAAARGVNVNQRLAERTLAFAPNYLRASLLFLKDIGSGGVKAKEAFTTLATLLGVGAAAYYGEEKLRGREPKMKPWPKRLGGDGAEAFTTEIAGNRVGVGSWIYGMIKTLSEIGAIAVDEPEALLKWNEKHPLARFAKSKTGPLVSLVTEMATGKTFFGRDFEGAGDYLKRIVESLMPIATQSLIEKSDLGRPTEPATVATRLAAEAQGLRAFPSTLRSQWAKDFQEYEALPEDPPGPVTQQTARRRYLIAHPEVSAKLFITGQKDSLTSPAAANSAYGLIIKNKINPDEVKGIKERKAEIEKRKARGEAPGRTNTDMLIQRLAQKGEAVSQEPPPPPPPPPPRGSSGRKETIKKMPFKKRR